MRFYLRFAISMCNLTGTEPSLLLHPLDFISKECDSDLSVFPAMGPPLARKMNLMDSFFEMLLGSFMPVTVGEHVENIMTRQALRNFRPTFSH